MSEIYRKSVDTMGKVGVKAATSLWGYLSAGTRITKKELTNVEIQEQTASFCNWFNHPPPSPPQYLDRSNGGGEMERDGSDMSSAVIFSITVSSVTLGPDSLEPKPRTLDSVTLGSEPWAPDPTQTS